MADEKKDLIAEENDEKKTSPSIKIGDKEYTEKEIQALEESKKFFQSENSKKEEKLKEYERLSEKVNDINSGEAKAELTQAEKDDLIYMKKIGFITQKEHEDALAKVKEETIKETEEKLTQKEKDAKKEALRKKIKAEITALDEKYSFVKSEDLEKFMSEKAEKGTVLSTEEAFKLFYYEQLVASGIKPENLPGVASEGSKKITEAPKSKVLDLSSPEMAERITEKLRGGV